MADRVAEHLIDIVGCKIDEVCICGTLTANLHMLMLTFYKPTDTRYKILYEKNAFSSDKFALESQSIFHGLDTNDALIPLVPRENEHVLRLQDILNVIDVYKDSLAMILLPGVQYYTGQLFEIAEITAFAKQRDIICGWDMAHAIGNVPLSLHDWNVDFAVWCHYKYLNSGPGAIGGYFVHQKHFSTMKPALYGWWGHKTAPFDFHDQPFQPKFGAKAFQLSNPTILSIASLQGALQTFEKAGGLKNTRIKSKKMTAFLEEQLKKSSFYTESIKTDDLAFTIITPSDAEKRGCQLSILLSQNNIVAQIMNYLKQNHLICDDRRPSTIRMAPNPLYNSYSECARAAEIFHQAMQSI